MGYDWENDPQDIVDASASMDEDSKVRLGAGETYMLACSDDTEMVLRLSPGTQIFVTISTGGLTGHLEPTDS